MAWITRRGETAPRGRQSPDGGGRVSPGRVTGTATAVSDAAVSRTVVPMTPVPIEPLPGSMTVPPLFGWENILLILIVLVAVAVAFFVASATGTDADGRSEWQAGLEARSRERVDPAAAPVERPAEPLAAAPDS